MTPGEKLAEYPGTGIIPGIDTGIILIIPFWVYVFDPEGLKYST